MLFLELLSKWPDDSMPAALSQTMHLPERDSEKARQRKLKHVLCNTGAPCAVNQSSCSSDWPIAANPHPVMLLWKGRKVGKKLGRKGLGCPFLESHAVHMGGC